jgi:hypothetical protein
MMKYSLEQMSEMVQSVVQHENETIQSIWLLYSQNKSYKEISMILGLNPCVVAFSVNLIKEKVGQMIITKKVNLIM